MSRRVLIGGLAVIAALLAVLGVLYFFGAPTPGSTVPVTQAQLESQPGGVVEQRQPPAAGKPAVPKVAADAKAPEPDPNSPLAISIPGCKCHSDDPKLVKQHEGYRMNQCAGCHAGQTPTGQ